MSESSGVLVETFPVGLLGCNCTILADRATKKAVLVDPGDDADGILERVRELELEVVSIIHTHAHIDHINGTKLCQDALSAPTGLHEDDLFLFADIDLQSSLLASFGLPPIDIYQPADPTNFLVGGDLVGKDRVQMEVLHTPGHTPGSLSFFLGGDQPILLSGDTLFSGGVGRTDLWKGDARQLARSIKDELYRLPEETVVIPGHGPTTTIGEEMRSNPFIRA